VYWLLTRVKLQPDRGNVPPSWQEVASDVPLFPFPSTISSQGVASSTWSADYSLQPLYPRRRSRDTCQIPESTSSSQTMMLFNDLVSGTPTIVTASRRRLEIGPCENDQISFSNFPFVRGFRMYSGISLKSGYHYQGPTELSFSLRPHCCIDPEIFR
jgi:hypothetical protein